MLCSKISRRLSPIPTITKNEMSKQGSSNRQRQDFWTTVLEPEKPDTQTDSECSGLRKSDDQQASQSTKKETPCPRCGSLFKRKYDLHQHISAVHDKNRPFKCDACDSCFAHKGTLSKHVRTVHKRERPYVCEHCGARFSERGNVNKHKQRAQSCRAAEEKARNEKGHRSK